MYLIFLILGFICGLLFYRYVLDKHEIIMQIRKQKARKGGLFRNILKSKNKDDV